MKEKEGILLGEYSFLGHGIFRIDSLIIWQTCVVEPPRGYYEVPGA
jgi:hypothetical protein